MGLQDIEGEAILGGNEAMIIANNVIHRWPAVAPRRAPCPPTAGPSACVVGLRCARRALNRGMPPPIATNPQWRRHHGRTTGVRHQHGARRERAGKGATITHEAGCTHFFIAWERSRGARGHQPDASRVQGGQGGCGMQGGRSDGGRAIGGPSTWHPKSAALRATTTMARECVREKDD